MELSIFELIFVLLSAPSVCNIMDKMKGNYSSICFELSPILLNLCDAVSLS